MSELSINSISSSPPTKVVDSFTKTKNSRTAEVKSEKPSVDVEVAEQAKADVKAQLDEQLRQINQKLSGENRRIVYSVHERTNRVVFSIVDKETGDVIKEVPSTKMLDIQADVLERFGLLIDKSV